LLPPPPNPPPRAEPPRIFCAVRWNPNLNGNSAINRTFSFPRLQYPLRISSVSTVPNSTTIRLAGTPRSFCYPRCRLYGCFLIPPSRGLNPPYPCLFRFLPLLSVLSDVPRPRVSLFCFPCRFVPFEPITIPSPREVVLFFEQSLRECPPELRPARFPTFSPTHKFPPWVRPPPAWFTVSGGSPYFS